MVANLQAFEPAERAAIERAVGRRAITQQRLVYTLSWGDLKKQIDQVLESEKSEIEAITADAMKLRAQAATAAQELKELIVPALVGVAPEGVSQNRFGQALEALELKNTFDALDTKLGASWPTVLPAETIDNVLARLTLDDNERAALLGTKPMSATERLTQALFGIDKILAVTKQLGAGVQELRKALRGTTQQGWPLDNALRLIRNAKDLDLVKEISTLIDQSAPKGSPATPATPPEGTARTAPDSLSLTAEVQKVFAPAVALLEQSNVEKTITTVGDLRKLLRRFDTPVDLAVRRLQRDVALTKSDLLQADMAAVDQKVAVLEERIAILNDRTTIAQDILAFIDGPLKSHKQAMVANALIDRVTLSNAEIASRLGVDAATIEARKLGNTIPTNAQLSQIEQLVRSTTDDKAFSFCPGRFLNCLGLTTIEGSKRPASLGDSVFTTVRHMVDSARQETKDYLVVPKDPEKSVSNMKRYNERLAGAAHAISAVAGYIRLQGELQVRKSLNSVAVARADHLSSIHRSEVEALGWKRLLNDGAEGLQGYWEGGVKPEHLAALLLLIGNIAATAAP